MTYWEKQFDKKFTVHVCGGIGPGYRTFKSAIYPKEVVSFIAEERKQLLKEVKEKAVLGGTDKIYSVPISKIEELEEDK